MAQTIVLERYCQHVVKVITRKKALPAQTSLIGIVDFEFQSLFIVPADPLICVPRDDLDRSGLVERHGSALGNDVSDFLAGEHAVLSGAFSCSGGV